MEREKLYWGYGFSHIKLDFAQYDSHVKYYRRLLSRLPLLDSKSRMELLFRNSGY